MSEFRNNVTNTAKLDPALLLLQALDASRRTGSASNAIEEQEKRGQAEFCRSDVMPVACDNLNRFDADRFENATALLQQIGFIVGGVVENDPLFQYAKPPNGWVKRATEHPMWSTYFDASGRERINVFYKAAHYDRRTGFTVRPFVSVARYHGVTEREIGVLGGSLFLKSFGEVETDANGNQDWKHREELCKSAEYWADEYFPERQDPLAYWDMTDEQLRSHLSCPPKGMPL